MTDKEFNNFKSNYAAFTMSIRLNAFHELNKKAKKGGIVFVGDSITEGFPVHELLTSTNKSVYNRGIAGDTSLGVLGKINDEVIDLAPSKVFLLVGTNDLGKGAQPSEVTERVKSICQRIREALPDTKIYVESIFPENKNEFYRNPIAGDSPRTNEIIIQTNEKLKSLCSDLELTYIDIFPKLLNEEGNLSEEFTYDGLHLTIEGYDVVCEILKDYLNSEEG